MATINEAKAMNMDAHIGILGAGKAADIAIFMRNGLGPYEAVVKGNPEDVALVLRGGDVLNGDENLVGAMNSNCDALDVCGIGKLICTQDETGMNLAAIQAEVPGFTPSFLRHARQRTHLRPLPWGWRRCRKFHRLHPGPSSGRR